MEHVWRWFCDLASTRTSNGFGPNPIGFSEIAAYDRLTDARITPWEVSVLRRLDAAVLVAMNSNTTSTADTPAEIAPDDAAGMNALFSSLKAKSKAVFGKK